MLKVPDTGPLKSAILKIRGMGVEMNNLQTVSAFAIYMYREVSG
jgi:hypothetical protein